MNIYKYIQYASGAQFATHKKMGAQPHKQFMNVLVSASKSQDFPSEKSCYKTSIIASQKQNNCHFHFPQTSNVQNLHHLVDLQALPAHYLEHTPSISVRLAASNAISGHYRFEQIPSEAFCATPAPSDQ